MERWLPVVVLGALYWPGVTAWFFQDDFGWLNLRRDVHSPGQVAAALFAPKAHGNLRPLGENAYWLGLGWAAGADPLPFHLAAFVTLAATLALLGSVVRRLSGSAAGALAAQAVWLVNRGVAPVAGWSSIYNQALSGFFLLLAFWFLLRGNWTGQWAAFLLGLGALEINVVYPALAAAYALLFARNLLRRILPMFAVSAAAVWIHFHFAPPPGAGVYAPSLDGRAFETVWTYWKWVLGPLPVAAALALTAGLAVATTVTAMRGKWLAVFGLLLFAITLAPYLPLPEHRMDYYLAVPAIGLAMAGGAAVAWRGWTAAGLAIYLAASAPAAWRVTRWQHARGEGVENLVLGVRAVHELAPERIVLLECIDTDLFWAGVADLPFRTLEIPRVYLAPGAEARIRAAPELLSKYVLPAALARPAAAGGRAALYCFDGETLHRASWETLPVEDEPRFVNLGDGVFQGYFGDGWRLEEDGLRTMDGTATVYIGGPRREGEALYIGVFETRDIGLRVWANGAGVGVGVASRGNDLTEFRAELPGGSVGQGRLEIRLRSERAARFGYLEIR